MIKICQYMKLYGGYELQGLGGTVLCGSCTFCRINSPGLIELALDRDLGIWGLFSYLKVSLYLSLFPYIIFVNISEVLICLSRII